MTAWSDSRCSRVRRRAWPTAPMKRWKGVTLSSRSALRTGHRSPGTSESEHPVTFESRKLLHSAPPDSNLRDSNAGVTLEAVRAALDGEAALRLGTVEEER